MDYEQITLDVQDHVATLTLNRPEALNAFTGKMMYEMIDAFDRTDADDDVRVVIVTGAGRAFCAGADLSGGGSTFDSEKSGAAAAASEGSGRPAVPRDGGGLLTLRIFDSKKPVIGAINGNAVGVGMTMTLPMDVRIASTNAKKLGFVFARRGIVPEACSSWFLPRLVGISQAMEWVATGRLFDAEEGLRAGLYKSVVEPDQLLPAARELAVEIAENTSPVSVALSRQMLWRMLGADHPMEAHKVDSRGIHYRGSSADAVEGVTSFLEKRPPQFSLTVSNDLPDLFPDWVAPTYD